MCIHLVRVLSYFSRRSCYGLGAEFLIRSIKCGVVQIGSLFPLTWIGVAPTKSPVCSVFQVKDSLYDRVTWGVILGSDNLPTGAPGK